MLCRRRDENMGHIGGRRSVLSTMRHHNAPPKLMDVECSDLSIIGFFSVVAGRLKAEATTTEAVKKDLPPLCKATERFEKQLNFLTITKEHIIFLSKINY